jgi:hypothetical protein
MRESPHEGITPPTGQGVGQGIPTRGGGNEPTHAAAAAGGVSSRIEAQ